MRKRERAADRELNAVRAFIATLWWAKEEYLDAMTLLLAVSHIKNYFPAIPYVLITSDKPGVGKSLASRDLPMLLASNPWRISVNTTADALRNKFDSATPPDTGLIDDAGKIYGEGGRGRQTSPVNQLAVDGYVRTATVSISRGGVTQDLAAYIMLWMNGIGPNVVPKDVRSRAIQFRVSAKPAKIRMRDALSPQVANEAKPLKLNLHTWAVSHTKEMQAFIQSQAGRIHPKLTDRTAQLWLPLFAIAHAAGGDWPRRCMAAFLAMALDEGEKYEPLAGERLLLDTARIITAHEARVVFTGELARVLRALPDGELYADADDDYLVGDLMIAAFGRPQLLVGQTLDGERVRGQGWMSAPILEAAADLYDELHPELEDTGPSTAQQLMEMTPVT